MFNKENCNLLAREVNGSFESCYRDGVVTGAKITVNNWVVSIQWGPGTYSDSGDAGDCMAISKTAEIAAWKSDSSDMRQWHKFGYDNVLGYQSFERVREFVKKLGH